MWIVEELIEGKWVEVKRFESGFIAGLYVISFENRCRQLRDRRLENNSEIPAKKT